MSDGVLIEYPTLAIYAAQFGEGALKDEARAVLAELEAERALADDLAADVERLQGVVNRALGRTGQPPTPALARYREARER